MKSSCLFLKRVEVQRGVTFEVELGVNSKVQHFFLETCRTPAKPQVCLNFVDDPCQRNKIHWKIYFFENIFSKSWKTSANNSHTLSQPKSNHNNMSLVVYEDEYPGRFHDEVVYVEREYWRERARDDVADLAARRLAARNLREANKRADEAEKNMAVRVQREIERNDRLYDFSSEQADKRERRLQREIEKADERADEADEQADKRVRRFKRAADEAEERADAAEQRADVAERRVAEMNTLLREYKYRLTKAEQREEALRVENLRVEVSGVSVSAEDSENSEDSQEAHPQVVISGVTDSSEVVCPDIVRLLFP